MRRRRCPSSLPASAADFFSDLYGRSFSLLLSLERRRLRAPLFHFRPLQSFCCLFRSITTISSFLLKYYTSFGILYFDLNNMPEQKRLKAPAHAAAPKRHASGATSERAAPSLLEKGSPGFFPVGLRTRRLFRRQAPLFISPAHPYAPSEGG